MDFSTIMDKTNAHFRIKAFLIQETALDYRKFGYCIIWVLYLSRDKVLRNYSETGLCYIIASVLNLDSLSYMGHYPLRLNGTAL